LFLRNPFNASVSRANSRHRSGIIVRNTAQSSSMTFASIMERIIYPAPASEQAKQVQRFWGESPPVIAVEPVTPRSNGVGNQ
jgi:hypothetical protein